MSRNPKLEDVPGVRQLGGEAVFQSPWEARSFAMALSLAGEGRYGWEEFRARLIAEINRQGQAEARQAYYESWLKAFERLLADKGLLSPGEIESKVAELAAAAPPRGAHGHGGNS